MELELKFAELACCEPVGDLVTTQEESMETAIPEYCPDIARIVDTVGQLRLREKHPAGQQLTVHVPEVGRIFPVLGQKRGGRLRLQKLITSHGQYIAVPAKR